MANHPSADKRHRQSRVRRIANRAAKSRVNLLVREVNQAVEAGDQTAAADKFRSAASALATAGSKKQVHKRNAARRIGRLARKIAAMNGS